MATLSVKVKLKLFSVCCCDPPHTQALIQSGLVTERTRGMQPSAVRYFEVAVAAVATGNRGGLDSDRQRCLEKVERDTEDERISTSLTCNWILDKHTRLNGTSWQ